MSSINYNKKEKYRLPSSYSIENRTTTSSHFCRTQRLIKDLHTLHSRPHRSRNYSTTTSSFYNPSPSFHNFHYQTLRNSIHNNEKYSSLFTSTSPTLYSLKKKPPPSIKHSLINPYTEPSQPFRLSITKHKHPHTNTKIRNTYTTPKRSNYRALTESLRDFVEKTQRITRMNYCNNVSKLNYEKRVGKKENEVDMVMLDLGKYENMERMLNTFTKTYKKYNKYLERVLSDNTVENFKLKTKRIQLLNDIHVLKTKLKRYQNVLEENIRNKYFLMCVKNNSSHHEMFSTFDKLEYEKDQQCLLKLSTLGQYLNYKKKLLKKTTINSRNLLTNTLSMDANKKHSQYVIFSSVEDFEAHLDNISHSIAKLLMQFNKNQNEIMELKREKSELQKPKSSDLYFIKEIKEAEDKLHALKLKNKELNDSYHSISTHSSKCNKMTTRIIKMFNMLNDVFKMKKHRTFTYNIGVMQYMQDIEGAVNKLMNIQQKYKQTYSSQYTSLQKEIDKYHKIELLKFTKEQGDKLYQDKIQKIIEHNKTEFHLKPNRRLLHYKVNTFALNKKKTNHNINENDNSYDAEIKYYFSNDK